MREGGWLAFGGLAAVATVLWFLTVASEPTEEVQRLQADSSRMHAELVVLRDSVRVYKGWLAAAHLRLEESCRLTPYLSYEACVAVVERKIERRGTR
jgi:hypothetical protein